MKIAIDAISLLSPLTGVGKYTYQIAKNLREIDEENEYHYFYGYYYSKRLRSNSEGGNTQYQIKETISKLPLLRSIARRGIRAFNYVWPRGFDLYFEPNFIPLHVKAKRTVVTIPDFSFKMYPQWHPRERVQYFERFFWTNIKKAHKIIAISDFIRKSALDFLGLPEEIIRTIYLGYDKEIFRTYGKSELERTKKTFNLPDKFMLFVGSIEPRKNLVNLARAYQHLGERTRKEFKLVLAGFKGWENKEIMEHLEKFKGDVLYLGYVPEGELGKIYNLATLFVYPSLYEGFGLPPLEAMACGCPVLTSKVASIPEVCGNAVYYVDPSDEEGITDGISQLLTDDDLRGRLASDGLARAQKFSWEKSAREHLQVFEELR